MESRHLGGGARARRGGDRADGNIDVTQTAALRRPKAASTVIGKCGL